MMKKPKNIAITGRVSDWMKNPEGRLPVSCTVFDVQDSMEGKNGIEQSWLFTSGALRYGAGVAINLSNLRSKGTTNSKGLVASGAVSFAQIYSQLNEILRRGGIYKNGAVVVFLDYNHGDLVEFLNATPKDLPWAKKTLYVDEHLLESPHIDLIIQKVRDGSVWLAKKQWDKDGNRLYSNVCNEVVLRSRATCVTADTWIQTNEGAKQVRDLIGVPFIAKVNGQDYSSTEQGFWLNGIKPVYKVITDEGYECSFTDNHKVLIAVPVSKPKRRKEFEYIWREVKDLQPGDKLAFNNHSVSPHWEGEGTFEQGWLTGSFLGDGHFETVGTGKYRAKYSQAALQFWGGSKEYMLDKSIDLLKESGFESTRKAHTGTLVKRDEPSLKLCSRALAKYVNQFGMIKGDKIPNEQIEKTSSSFYCGFLQGLFDADGTVNLGCTGMGGKRVSLASANLYILKRVQRMLLRLGIFSRIYSNHNGRTSVINKSNKTWTVNSSPLWNLSITQQNIAQFSALIGFSEPNKINKLQQLLDSYISSPRREFFQTTVKDVVFDGIEEVYDCTIHEVHEFDANGFRAHNCLLAHVNLGKCKIDEIAQAFEDGMRFLCELHPQTGVDKQGIYLSPNEDKQVGLGVLGLANLLAIEEVKYSEFVDALENRVYDIESSSTSLSSKAAAIVDALLDGFDKAEIVARKYGMQRAFTIAPTASVAYRNRDREMFTTAPEISPPINNIVDRDSGTFGVTNYEHNPKGETAREVGWDVQYRLMKAWQSMMDRTGLAHAISFNIWNTCTVDKDFIADWLTSPLKTTYYRLPVEQDFLDKSRVITEANINKKDSTAVELCNLDGLCTSCAE